MMLLTLMMMLVSGSEAVASGDRDGVGNGGGVWVCRDARRNIIWAEVVDLFEAREEFGLTPLEENNELSIQVWIQAAAFKVMLSDSSFYERFLSHSLTTYMSEQMIFDKLPLIADAHLRVTPQPTTCAGTIEYEQGAVYTHAGSVWLNLEIWAHLSTKSVAALYVHEILYAAFREFAGDTDSDRTRRIVGLLFSEAGITGPYPASAFGVDPTWFAKESPLKR